MKGSKVARPDYATSTWAKMFKYNHDDMLNDATREAKRFRRCFRVPYKIFFEVLVPHCKDVSKPIFSQSMSKFCIPVEIKVLIAQRILGRDDVPTIVLASP